MLNVLLAVLACLVVLAVVLRVIQWIRLRPFRWVFEEMSLEPWEPRRVFMVHRGRLIVASTYDEGASWVFTDPGRPAKGAGSAREGG